VAPAITSGSIYHLYVCALVCDGGDIIQGIFDATSTNGLTFTVNSTPVITGYVTESNVVEPEDPAVIMTDNGLRLYFAPYGTQGSVIPESGIHSIINKIISSDAIPPVITDIQATPQMQEINGCVNITCTVTDNEAVNVVKVNITCPNGTTKNITMMQVGANSYTYNASYSVLGTYSYYIWANDTSNNQNKSATYTFSIRDSTKPSITNVQATPSSQIVGSYVNITCTATDNVAVDVVKVNITGPVGFTPVNITMIKIAGTSNYYYNSSYSIMGTYSYYIWANDTSNNQNISIVNMFEVYISNQPPEAVISSPLNNDVFLTTDSIFFDGSNSSDPDNDDLMFYWSSNISGYLSNESQFYIALPPGYHLITLFVNDGVVNVSAMVNITVNEPVINLPPTAVLLYEPTGITTNSMLISWSQNTDSDFSNYAVYQSAASGDIGIVICTEEAQSNTSCTVIGLSPSTTYYFTIRVYDTEGLCNDSNQVSGATIANTGNLTGIVTDKNSKPVEGATVRIVATSHVTWTDSNGKYTFIGVYAAAYGVNVEKTGYKTKTVTGVNIKPGETTTLNIILEKEKKTEEKGLIPGFETVAIIIALGIIMLLRRKLL